MHLNLFERRAMFYLAAEVVHSYFERDGVKYLGDLLLVDEKWLRMNGPSYTDGPAYVNRLLKALTGHYRGELDGLTVVAYQEARHLVADESFCPEQAWPNWYVRSERQPKAQAS